MPILGNALDFAKYEAKNVRGHQLGTAPAAPVTGQVYYNTGDNTLYWYDGSAWVSARGGASATPPATTLALGTIQLAGDLTGTATSPQIAAGAVTDAEVAAANKDGAAGTASMRTLGTGATQAAPGNDARFGATGTAGGDLTGTYPNPQIAAGVITDADVNAANKDGAVGTASMRTLGSGAQQAMAGATKLNAIPVPNGSVNMSNQEIVNLQNPSSDSSAATKLYVDTVAQGLAPKDSVRAATTGNIVIATALNNADVIDGVTLASTDRVLVKDQSAPAENGIYIVGTTPVRASDADYWPELPAAFTFVEQGTVNADTGWVCTSDQGGTLGTTAVTWAQFSGAGQIIAGTGLTKTGNTLDVGAGAGITVNADTVQVSNNGITNAMLADGAVNLATADVTGYLPVGNGGTGAGTTSTARAGLGAAGYYSNLGTHSAGTTISIPYVNHGLRAARGLIVQCQLVSTGEVLIPDVSITSGGDVTITFGVSQSANTIHVTIIG